MTTLTQPGLSSLIDRLFAEADAAEDARWPAAAGDRADYRQYYGQLKDQPLPVSRATGKLLYIRRGPFAHRWVSGTPTRVGVVPATWNGPNAQAKMAAISSVPGAR